MHHLLVVDDELSLRVTLQAILSKAGYVVDVAEDAQTALQLIENIQYDVILTDIIMPRMSGMEMLERIRSHSQSVQILVMTGEPTIDTAMQAVKIGAGDYLAKPIDKETLLMAVRQAVQIKQLNDEKMSLEAERTRYLQALEQTVRARTEALEVSMKSIMMLFSSVVEMRDPYTAGHQRKVGNLAAAIAVKLGEKAETANNLRMTGYLHDIGKMAVPAEILIKPGRLSNLEMDFIRIHSQQGYAMLQNICLPEKVKQVVYQHHERLDGSGYPQGLKDTQILQGAKILAVADVVEAMMSHRPYRPALGLEIALSEITDHAGNLYDPAVAAACVHLFEDDHYALEDKEYDIQFPLS